MRGGKKTKKATSMGNTSRSVMGRLMPPVDIQDESMLGELDQRLLAGPITLVLVYADWCGHCNRFKPMMSQLENTAGRSVQTVRIRDDVFPKSSIAKNKISGYPSLMLVEKNGNATVFKSKDGEVSNTIPEYTDMQKMTAIVRNAGSSEGLTMLGSTNATPKPQSVTTNDPMPKNIVADRLSSTDVSNLNRTLAESANATIREATANPLTKPQQGGSFGGLWGHVLAASQRMAPAAALFLASGAVSGKSKRKTRKARRTRRRV